MGVGEGGMIWKSNIETCIIIYETDHQFRFDAWDSVLRAGPVRWPRGLGGGEIVEMLSKGKNLKLLDK